MNFDELNKIVAREAGVSICPICGTPYAPYHSRQKTCGTEECKRLYKNEYLKERKARLMKEDIDAFRKYRADAQRKSRRKKRNKELVDDNYQRIQQYWEEQTERRIETDGIEYGKKQVERTLALVSKIDVNIGGKK